MADLRTFLELPYDELEQLNLKAKEQRKKRVSPGKIQEERLRYLTDEKRIKARRPVAHARLRQEVPHQEL
jgi:glutamine synthetase